MKKLCSSLLLCALLLTGCALSASPSPAPAQGEGGLRILATTYPVYLFTTAVTDGAQGVEVELLVNSQTSCLHDYTLTVNDMKAIEGADVIVMNGVGLEEFMADALEGSEAQVIDCSAGLELLPAQGHEGHEHGTDYDPHIWMDPDYAVQMMGNIALGLDQALYGENWAQEGTFHTAYLAAKDELVYAAQGWLSQLEGKELPGLITFHDGFQYFARYYGLDLLKAIEEEEGAEASAAEIKQVVELVQQGGSPAIFT